MGNRPVYEKPPEDGGARFLVVDDNDDNRYSLTQRLKRLGYTNVLTADNGRRALEMIRDEPLDIVLLDILMPEVDGFQVLDRLRERGLLSRLPVIVISALDDIESVVRCIELGAEDYLPKPFNATLLEARINGTLEKKRLHDEVRRQLSVIRSVFGKYVPDGVVDALVSGHGELAPTHATATILYSDIAGFTAISEQLSPERVLQMLNEYFPAVIEPIMRYGGVVNQFQGDAMLVTFNIPLADTEHAQHAVSAAREMQRILKGRDFAGVRLKTRIGINTGRVVAGNVGSGERVNYTVHGDAVNLAARLEQLNKEYDTLVLVSENTAALLGDRSMLEPRGAAEIRGVQVPVPVYTLTGD